MTNEHCAQARMNVAHQARPDAWRLRIAKFLHMRDFLGLDRSQYQKISSKMNPTDVDVFE